MENFTFQGPLGPIECIVESLTTVPKEAVLIMAHGFRGSRDSMTCPRCGLSRRCPLQCSAF